jgi:integrase
MFRRYVATALAKKEISESFTLCDLKGKGATDMWHAGMPLVEIQVLCGHDSVTTTEVSKRHMASDGHAKPNRHEDGVDLYKSTGCTAHWILAAGKYSG